MISLLPAIALFLLLIYLFFREARLDKKRWAEEDRLGDEHIMREIEKFKQKIKYKPVQLQKKTTPTYATVNAAKGIELNAANTTPGVKLSIDDDAN